MLKCTKMNGNGNDFLVINNLDKGLSTEFLSELAVKACRRREAVGADGLLIAEPSERCDFKMRLFNSDGSEGEMCGNGSRCIARFALEEGIVEKNEMVFETLGGDIHAWTEGRRASIEIAQVDPAEAVLGAVLEAEGVSVTYSTLIVGVPHTVVFEKEHSLSDAGYRELGRAIRNMQELFPRGTNVNFAAPGENPGSLDVITYERGVEDLTLSCGTGSTASVIAGWLTGLCGPEVSVKNPGGVNNIRLRRLENGKILPALEGEVLRVAEFELTKEILR